MPRPAEGTREWFDSARHQCVDHLRALVSVRTADEYMSAILNRYMDTDSVTVAGLHSASVLAYARPFVGAKTKTGERKYPEGKLRKASGFDRELHGHLLELRHRLIAHADYGLLASTMNFQSIGDEALPVSMEINVKTIFGFEGRKLGLRYQAHFRACMTFMEESLNQEVRALIVQSKKYPMEFAATHNIPPVETNVKLAADFADFPDPEGPSSTVAEPSFPGDLEGYRYLMLSHRVPLLSSGEYRIHQDGKEIPFFVE